MTGRFYEIKSESVTSNGPSDICEQNFIKIANTLKFIQIQHSYDILMTQTKTGKNNRFLYTLCPLMRIKLINSLYCILKCVGVYKWSHTRCTGLLWTTLRPLRSEVCLLWRGPVFQTHCHRRPPHWATLDFRLRNCCFPETAVVTAAVLCK